MTEEGYRSKEWKRRLGSILFHTFGGVELPGTQSIDLMSVQNFKDWQIECALHLNLVCPEVQAGLQTEIL